VSTHVVNLVDASSASEEELTPLKHRDPRFAFDFIDFTLVC
jgi:hypothetical protein